MLISNNDAARRLGSSQNLMNRLNQAAGNGKSGSARAAMSLFGIGKKSEPLTSDTATLAVSEVVVTPTQVIQPIQVDQVIQVVTPTEVLDPHNSPVIDSILDNIDAKLNLELAHNESLGAMVDSIKLLRLNLPEISRPEKLAEIASKMSGIVDRIRGERNKNSHGKTVNIHLYNPTQRQLSEYEAVDV